MKLKLIASIAVLAALAVPAVSAQAKTTSKQAAHCARVAVDLKGTVSAAPGTGATQFTMSVKHSSHAGTNLAGQSLTISTNSHTKITRLGKKANLASLQANDRVNVLLKVCKRDLPLSQATLSTTPAKRVTATVAGKGYKP